MKNLIRLLPLLLLPILGQAQTNVYWGLSLHPHYSNSRLISLGTFSDSILVDIASMETGRFSYSVGGNITWLGPKVGFQMGLGFSQTGYRTLEEAFPAGEPNPENATGRRFEFINNNIEAPIELIFMQAVNEKNHFLFMMGTALSFNLSNRTKTILLFGDTQEASSEKDEVNDFRSFNYAFQTGMGWKRQLSESFDLVIQPTFVFWLQGVLEDTELNRSIFSLGLQVELLLKR